MRPADLVAPKEEAPLMMETNTKGTTSILISWMNKSPKGPKIEAFSPIHIPTMIPANIAKKIRKLKFLNSLYNFFIGFFKFVSQKLKESKYVLKTCVNYGNISKSANILKKIETLICSTINDNP